MHALEFPHGGSRLRLPSPVSDTRLRPLALGTKRAKIQAYRRTENAPPLPRLAGALTPLGSFPAKTNWRRLLGHCTASRWVIRVAVPPTTLQVVVAPGGNPHSYSLIHVPRFDMHVRVWKFSSVRSVHPASTPNAPVHPYTGAFRYFRGNVR